MSRPRAKAVSQEIALTNILPGDLDALKKDEWEDSAGASDKLSELSDEQKMILYPIPTKKSDGTTEYKYKIMTEDTYRGLIEMEKKKANIDRDFSQFLTTEATAELKARKGGTETFECPFTRAVVYVDSVVSITAKNLKEFVAKDPAQAPITVASTSEQQANVPAAAVNNTDANEIAARDEKISIPTYENEYLAQFQKQMQKEGSDNTNLNVLYDVVVFLMQGKEGEFSDDYKPKPGEKNIPYMIDNQGMEILYNVDNNLTQQFNTLLMKKENKELELPSSLVERLDHLLAVELQKQEEQNVRPKM